MIDAALDVTFWIVAGAFALAALFYGACAVGAIVLTLAEPQQRPHR